MGRGEYTFDALYRHIEDVVDAISREPTVVVAQSMAGPLGYELALSGRWPLSRLVLISPVGLGTLPFIRLAQLLRGRVLDRIAPLLLRRAAVRAALGAA